MEISNSIVSIGGGPGVTPTPGRDRRLPTTRVVVAVAVFGYAEWEGPVVWWQPTRGERHAFPPDRRPRPGQERETVCGEQVTLVELAEVDWLAPTCDACMAEARTRRDARAERDREARRARERVAREQAGRWTR